MPIRVYVLVGHANFNSISLGTYPYSYCCSYRTFAIPIRSLLHANTVHGSMPTQVQNYGCGMVYIWNHESIPIGNQFDVALGQKNLQWFDGWCIPIQNPFFVLEKQYHLVSVS